MARFLFPVLALAFIALVHGEKSFASTHSVILQKFHPIVKDFATSLASKIGESDQILETVVYDAITKTLAAEVDDLVAKGNNSKTEFCCSCKKCDRKCRQCGKSCCCKGSGGCSCKSCVGDNDALTMFIESVSEGQTSYRKMWAEAAKQTLVREVRKAVSAYGGAAVNAQCCACKKCKGYAPACGFPVCCTKGDICVCKSCDGSNVLQMDSVENLVALTTKAEMAVQDVEQLIDQLTTVMLLL